MKPLKKQHMIFSYNQDNEAQTGSTCKYIFLPDNITSWTDIHTEGVFSQVKYHDSDLQDCSRVRVRRLYNISENFQLQIEDEYGSRFAIKGYHFS
jgi:hypothetical protein